MVLLDALLGIRRGELGALRWQECDFENGVFHIQHSYYWRRGGILKTTKTEASAKPIPMHPALKQALLEWRIQSPQTENSHFVFPSRLYRGQRALDLRAALKRKIRPTFEALGDQRCGLAYVSAHSRNVVGGDGRASVDDPRLLRHSNLSVTNKYLQAASGTRRRAQEIGRSDFASATAGNDNRRCDCTLVAPRISSGQAVSD